MNNEKIENKNNTISIKQFMGFLIIIYLIFYLKSGYSIYVFFIVFFEILGGVVGAVVIPAIFIGISYFIGFIRKKPKNNFLYKLIIGSIIITIISIFTKNSKYFEHPILGFILLGILGLYILYMLNQNLNLSTKKISSEKEKKKDILNKLICKKCQKENNFSNKFCIHCGKKITIIQEKSEINFNELEETKMYNEVIKNYDGVLVALLAKIAKLDGKISHDEAKYINKIYDELSLTRKDIRNIRDIYKKILKNEKINLDNLKLLCSYLTQNSDEFSRISMLRTLIELAHIDNEYSKEKENLIIRIIYILNIDFSIYKQLISEFKKNDSSGNSSTPNSSYLTIDECYKFLESTKENSNVEIKKNYRKLVKQYSTDMLSNKELPSDIISFAEEKLKKINIAYEKIEKYRGIK